MTIKKKTSNSANNTEVSVNTAPSDYEIITQIPLKDLKSIFDTPKANMVGRKILDYYADNSISLTSFDCDSYISYIKKIDRSGSKAKYTNYVTKQIITGYSSGIIPERSMQVLIVSYSSSLLSVRNEFMPFLLNEYLENTNHSTLCHRNVYKNLSAKQHLMWRKFIVENNLDVDRYVSIYNNRSSRRAKYSRDDFYADLPENYQIGIII